MGIQAVGKAVARDLGSVGSYEQRRCRQELPLPYEFIAAVLRLLDWPESALTMTALKSRLYRADWL